MEQFEAIPDEVIEDMLVAAGKVVVAAHKRKIVQFGLVKDAKLLNSITAHSKAGGESNNFQRHVLIYPEGKHHTYNRKLKVKTSKKGKTYKVGGDVKTVFNNDVGFIHEFGAPHRGIKAKQWMEIANEECADDVALVELGVYNSWLTSIGL